MREHGAPGITMHELSIAEALLAAALDVSEQHGRHRLQCLHVRLGCLRQVVPEALLLAFEALTAGTPSAGAILTWEEVPVRIRCRRCDMIFSPSEAWFWSCPACDAPGGEVLAGEELLLERVTFAEVEDGSPGPAKYLEG